MVKLLNINETKLKLCLLEEVLNVLSIVLQKFSRNTEYYYLRHNVFALSARSWSGLREKFSGDFTKPSRTKKYGKIPLNFGGAQNGWLGAILDFCCNILHMYHTQHGGAIYQISLKISNCKWLLILVSGVFKRGHWTMPRRFSGA